MRYIVTQEIKSETQVLWFIYLQDLAFLTVWTMLVLVLKRKCTRIFADPLLHFFFCFGGTDGSACERKSKTPVLSGVGNLYCQTEKYLPLFQGGQKG